MQRFAIRIVATLITFVVGITATYLYHKYHIQFECTAMGSILVKPNGHGRAYAYKSYDGVDLGFAGARFPTHKDAEEAFHIILKDAVRIIEREPLYDPKGGNLIGEKVIAIFPPNDYVKTEWASVIWFDDMNLCQISSPSLHHVLAYCKIMSVTGHAI